MNEETDEIKISKLLDYDPHLAAQLYKGLGYDFDEFVKLTLNRYKIYYQGEEKDIFNTKHVETDFRRLLYKNKEYTLVELLKVMLIFNSKWRYYITCLILNKYWK